MFDKRGKTVKNETKGEKYRGFLKYFFTMTVGSGGYNNGFKKWRTGFNPSENKSKATS